MRRLSICLIDSLQTVLYQKALNFDDSEKMRMLREHGVLCWQCYLEKINQYQHKIMINVLTAKNIFLPLMNDGVVGNIGIINQKDNHLDEHEIIQAVGTPENIFTGNNGTANIVVPVWVVISSGLYL